MNVTLIMSRTIKNSTVLACALCLVWSAIGYAVPPAHAQDQGSAGVPQSSEPLSSDNDSQNKAVLGITDASKGLTDAQLAPEVKILRSIERDLREKAKKEIYERSTIPSLIMTPAQHALLREARVGFNTRLPTLQELKEPGDPNDPNYRPPVALREIKLGGIAFLSPDDWTIWLNNARVTPDALPSEALDIHVYKEFIEIKWFDSVTSQVFPIRLRPNQKFNLDTRIFLPG